MELTLRPAGAGDKSEIIAYLGASSVLTALNDNSDTTYVQTQMGLLTSLFTLPAHGLAAGTTINSVTLYYRGRMKNIGDFAGVYQRSGDGAETADTLRADADWTTYSLLIPAPDGGWTLAHLTNLQIGAAIRGGGVAGQFGQMADVWAVVDYTEPVADAFLPRVRVI